MFWLLVSPEQRLLDLYSVFPYNKDYTKWQHLLWRKLAGTGLQQVMLNLHVKLGFGQRMKPSHWWRGNVHAQ
jgi:hypothetical protein